MVTVRGSAGSVELRLLAGVLRCPCGGALRPWGHARRRLAAMPSGWAEFWPRRGRCRECGRTHVLLPADLWSRRRYGAAVIMTVLVLGARASAAGRAAARPWAAAPGGGRRAVPGSTARSWRSRFEARADGLRGQLMRVLPLVSGAEAARPLMPSGSAGGDCLAVLEAVTAGLRRFPGLAAVASHEAAAHLSGGLWLAPAVPVLEFNTTLFPAGVISPS
ncbi:MAG: DUF6431 domain-containing protein [Trebonia sp.]